ncbi:MAG: hypothetical protein XE11_1692 [Methanomicrobiales archaeon 53_19]|jgi:hypothetical protein|uniref:hypothetical protein n=1 Tax=Methanocalculus sp. TaxID=2004547 RepID=UPI0007477421|nr:hypothetical protein [Methanocalculus sp.]KUK68215.1 MAG: hypothetical protein XD88_1996 [Methanocalculus sp. 52_23]KUL02642.1 MAG: hypothetical protein XE11_1692 [Methanomicrobiales archaeon 53_19]HIJ07524.1 hypothetical protein [Methanocalculus sp.]
MDAICLLRETELGRQEALCALRHLPLSIRKALLSPDYETRRRAQGRFFEAATYELLRKAGAKSRCIDRIAAWGADVGEYGGSKKGIWYSRDGGLRICADGAIAAEVDLLFEDNTGAIFFAEATIAHPSASAFSEEVEKKRALLSDLAGGRGMQFLYITPTPPPQSLSPLFEADGGMMIVRADLLGLVTEVEDVLGSPRKRRPVHHPKVVSGTAFFHEEAKREKRGFLSYIQRFFLK